MADMVGEYSLTWTRSPTDGVTRQLVKMVNDGQASEMALAADVEQVSVLVKAGKDFSFVVTSIKDFVASDSAADAFTAPSFDPPDPATNLAHTLVAAHPADQT